MSNRLPVLLEEIKSASVVFEQARRTTADAIIVMGTRLVEAKELCAHGEWQDFLRKTQIPVRSAQRYMRVVQAGVDTEYLEVVGLLGALAEIDEAQKIMPPPGHAIVATWEAEGHPDVMLWWTTGRFTAGFAQAYNSIKTGGVRATIFDSMPAHLVAFVVDVFARGLWLDAPRPELSRRTIGMDKLDEKLALLRDSMEGGALEPA